MEVDLFSNVVSEEDTVEVDVDVDVDVDNWPSNGGGECLEYNDNFGVEGERCGLCMDIVVDRGVLDCCQHWFCFACIDNWSTITNLCPLCQNEFQLITCVPVYDTIGGNKMDEALDLREDDWCVEGQNNTLSFPSYYIDENAVTCLDGDNCKIRSGLMTYEETLTLDTSIACDSCDIWYHAFCVGFDPEGADVDSWLCPRCLSSESQKKSDFKDLYRNQLSSETVDHHCLVDTYTGKVSISVADAGETALVVSRIDGENLVEEPISNGLPVGEVFNHCEIQQSVLGLDSCSSELKRSSDKGIQATQLEPAVPSAAPSESIVKSEPIDLAFSGAASLSEDDKTKIMVAGNETLLVASANESLEDLKADIAPKIGGKRKRTDYSFLTNDEDEHNEVGFGSGSSTRKIKTRRGLRSTSSNDAAHISDNQKSKSWVESSADGIGGNLPAKKTASVDIMSIVRGTEPKKANRLLHKKETDKCGKGQNIAARLRVKKIMRRSDDQESVDVVQKLRKEIREAVRKKPSDETGKGTFDPNLLAAFRAAVTGSGAEPVNKSSVKAKKSMLQKSKTRDNLTKKIYATSNGKRRRAWDRDCEVEFWKHRCTTTGKAEKIETLISVLNLLRDGPEAKKVEQGSEVEADAPILSRLYLADASVFPRKNDIKPLSVLKATSGSQQNEECSSGSKDAKTSLGNCSIKSPGSNEAPSQNNVSVTDDKNIKSNSTLIKNAVVCDKLQTDRQHDKLSSQKTTTNKTNDVKVDKRKWALEVLARKTASNSQSPMHQKQDNAALKGNYPLLAELPTDMRPKLAPVCHNKIPVSIRQAQLYRFTELFLKMANLSSIRRTAATELAVADAINIERQVAERSTSKTVYMNMCAQERRHCMNCNSSSTPVECTSSPLPVSNDGGESTSLSHHSEAEAALRAAGLLSDSPPCSPTRHIEDHQGNENPVGEVEEEETKDIFEMDSQPDLDIYGDFEYDLDEEDYFDAGAIKVSKSQTEEGESKVKVVFSTFSSNKTVNPQDTKELDSPKTDIQRSTTSLLESCNHVESGSSATDQKMDSMPMPADISENGEGEELSVAECEELYGPDKEPLVTKFPELLPAENLAPQSTNSEENNLVPGSSDQVAIGSKSPSSSLVDNSQDEKNHKPKIDKNSEHVDSVLKKVEAYIKEHIRPLCKSGVITVDQYRWAVGKTTDKVMKHHSKAKNANFLIKEGEKVKKLAEQYVEAAKKQGK